MATAETLNQAGSIEHPLPMHEAMQGDTEAIAELYKRLVELELPAFVIRQALSDTEVSEANATVESRDTLALGKPMEGLHLQGAAHLEELTGVEYQRPRRISGQTGESVDHPNNQINVLERGQRSSGWHDDSGGSYEDANPDIIQHAVLDGAVRVQAVGLNTQPGANGSRERTELDPDIHEAHLGPGDAVVFRQNGTKPTVHEFVTTSETPRASGIQGVARKR